MWAAIGTAIVTLLMEMIGFGWRRTNAPKTARDVADLPDGLRDQFERRVRQHQNSVRQSDRS